MRDNADTPFSMAKPAKKHETTKKEASDSDEEEWNLDSDERVNHERKTSQQCQKSLANLMQDPLPLAVATEASSNSLGLDALYAQPWVYAGGGLGNIDECPLQVCLAGGNKRDSLTFASVCIVPECDAYDLSSDDFIETLASVTSRNTSNAEASQAYFRLHKNIAEVNELLGTGWACGRYHVEWQPIQSILYIAVVLMCFSLSLYSILRRLNHSRNRDEPYLGLSRSEFNGLPKVTLALTTSIQDWWSEAWSKALQFWDTTKHAEKLFIHRAETSCLDGLKVLSILWVISGHVMAIQSSSGPGYLNPAKFLPPEGITSTFWGQLLFSSRFAVDTFLCISGYLVVHVLRKKVDFDKLHTGWLLLFRILRIMPLYMTCLGFWMFIAPHLGSGPFWFQWKDLLEPCQRYWWTNLIFVNNIVPFGPTTETCFYHSWYLALDFQLFFLFAPWLISMCQKSPVAARRSAALLWVLSVLTTAVLAYFRKWSVNTFDGMAVAIFDIEGYAKPHVRAQSYLAGMFVAMLPKTRARPVLDKVWMGLSVLLLGVLSFITVTGAYARRPCMFQEWPSKNECGSLWSQEETFLYTAFSRGLWSLGISVIIYLCTQQRGYVIEDFLSCRVWTPLAHLSFGAYLIHPILLFIMQLGEREKTSFRLASFLMDFISVSFVSYTLSAFASLIIEFPICDLIKSISSPSRPTHGNGHRSLHEEEEALTSGTSSSTYGSVVEEHQRA